MRRQIGQPARCAKSEQRGDRETADVVQAQCLALAIKQPAQRQHSANQRRDRQQLQTDRQPQRHCNPGQPSAGLLAPRGQAIERRQYRDNLPAVMIDPQRLHLPSDRCQQCQQHAAITNRSIAQHPPGQPPGQQHRAKQRQQRDQDQRDSFGQHTAQQWHQRRIDQPERCIDQP